MAGPSSHWVENMRRIRNFAHSILLKNIRVLRVAAERFSTYSVKLQLFAFCPLTVGFTIVPRKGEEINDLMRQHIYIFCKIFLFHGVLVVLVITFILIILCYESSSLQDSLLSSSTLSSSGWHYPILYQLWLVSSSIVSLRSCCSCSYQPSSP